MRPFTESENKNLKFLVNLNIRFTQVEVTTTGLKKSILDATAPMRAFFMEEGIHSYDEQAQGTENKVFYNASILTETAEFRTKASFYRPVTKKGDPRLWIYGLGSYSQGNDIYVLVHHDRVLYAVNITHMDIGKCCHSVIGTPLQDVLRDMSRQSNSIAEELLSRFKSVSGQWFKSQVTADTGIGRTIETFLGIKMNSDKTPDYKGIEIKSHREKRKSKMNVLFTQTPDWDISALKSGKEIVGEYGYFSDGKKTYQNTVRCTPPNSQALFLNVNQLKNLLELKYDEKLSRDVAVWRLLKLHERLTTKHHETFWVEVENRMEDGKEYFRYKLIEHTRNPNVGQFDVLLEQNAITVDLSLCRPSGSGDNYLFKITKAGMALLFPESVLYDILGETRQSNVL